MKSFVFPFVVLLSLTISASAQEGDDDGSSMMDRGVRQFLEGLLLEMEPALDDVRAFLEQMGPAMEEILKEVQDWSAYEPPEFLDNGDIIIRRKPDHKKEEIPKREPLPQIEL